MRQRTLVSQLGLAAVLLLAGSVFAAPTAYWRFGDGPPGDRAVALASEVNGAVTAGKGSVRGEGSPPVFDPDVPGAEIWDGSTGACVNPDNQGCLRFVRAGGEVTVPGAARVLHPREFTVEVFVKVERPMPQHMILVSKRRKDFGGCTWSLSVTPKGALQARCDTQAGQTGKNGVDWNQTVAAAGTVADGQWHHVALTYEHAQQRASLLIDHVLRGSRRTKAALVYDASDFIIGRGVVGLID